MSGLNQLPFYMISSLSISTLQTRAALSSLRTLHLFTNNKLFKSSSPLRRRSSSRGISSSSSEMEPPKTKKVKHEMEMFGDVRVDNYYWLRDDSRSDPEVLAHLRQENAYVDHIMSGTKKLEDQIYSEIRGRVKEDDISAPLRRGPYYYYKRTLEGKEYTQHCRRLVPNTNAPTSVHDTMSTGSDAPPEHVILDENVKAQQHGFYIIGAFKAKSLLISS